MATKVEQDISAELEMYLLIVQEYSKSEPVSPGMPNLNSQMAALTAASFIVRFAELNSLNLIVDGQKTDIKAFADSFADRAESKYEDIQKNIAEALTRKNPRMAAAALTRKFTNRFQCNLMTPWNVMRKKYKKRYPRKTLPKKQEVDKSVLSFCKSTPGVKKQLKDVINTVSHAGR